MPAASYTETALSDNVTVVCNRFRTGSGPSTFDWNVTLIASVVDASGNVIQRINVDVSTLFSAGAMTTFKGTLTTGVSTAATNRSIAANT